MAKRGRPRKNIDDEKLRFAFSLGATLAQAAGYCEVSHFTLEKYIKETYGQTVMEFRDVCLAGTRLKLIQKALSMAENGSAALMIFALKNLLGWTDRVEHGFDESKRTVLLKYNLDPKDEPKEE